MAPSSDSGPLAALKNLSQTKLWVLAAGAVAAAGAVYYAKRTIVPLVPIEVRGPARRPRARGARFGDGVARARARSHPCAPALPRRARAWPHPLRQRARVAAQRHAQRGRRGPARPC